MPDQIHMLEALLAFLAAFLFHQNHNRISALELAQAAANLRGEKHHERLENIGEFKADIKLDVSRLEQKMDSGFADILRKMDDVRKTRP